MGLLKQEVKARQAWPLDEPGAFSAKGPDESPGTGLLGASASVCAPPCAAVEVGGTEGKEGVKVLDNYEN